MSEGYSKLFSDIVDSSIWEESPEICKVWVTLLALCNADGFVRGSDGWLAGKSKVTLDSCQSALAKFQSPDPRSRTRDNDGRRIEQLSDGWLILNYLTFRDRLSTNPKAVATRLRVKKHRERDEALRNAESVTLNHSASASASVPSVLPEGGSGGKCPEIEVPSWQEVQVECQKIGLVEWRARDWFEEMEQCGWKDNKNREVMKWRPYLARVRTWWERDGRPMQPPLRANGEKPMTPMAIKTIIEAKKVKASELRTKYCSDTAIDTIWSDSKKRSEFFSIQKEIKALNNQLSNMA